LPGSGEHYSLTINGAGADITILNRTNTGRILRIDTTSVTDDSDVDIVIQGLTFQGGNDTSDGGAAYVYTKHANITILDVIFTNNDSDGSGGGLYAETDTGSISVTDSTFSDNTGDGDGAGAYFYSSSGLVSISGSTFTGNEAPDNGNGGGLYADTDSGAIMITGNTFTDNIIYEDGGGAYCTSGTGSITLSNNLFTGNIADSWGGGAAVRNGDSLPTITTMTNNTFLRNTSNGYGGGAAVNAYAPVLTNNVFIGNTNISNNGGGAWVQSKKSTATITNNSFTANTAMGYGGGLSVNPYGEGAAADIYNNLIWGNTANHGGNDGNDLHARTYVNGLYQALALFNNDLGENSNFATGQSEDLYITDTTNYTHGNNITADPLFKDAANDDLHLTEGSPAIDKGDNAAPSIPATDFEGDDRVIDGDGNGSAIADMGADEFIEQSPIPRSIPTLSEWGMMTMCLLLLAASVYYIRKKSGLIS
jgi:predicted outer membrane repeat protein